MSIRLIPPQVRLDATTLVLYLGVPSRSVDWSLTGAGTLTAISTYTDPQGRAYAQYDPSGATAGDVVEITAEAGGAEWALSITNPGAETADTTGWTVVSGFVAYTGAAGVSGAHSGTHYFYGAIAGATGRMYQDIALPAASLALCDAGSLDAELTWWQASFAVGDDEGRAGLEWLDSEGGSLGTDYAAWAIPGTTWTERTHSPTIPVGTRAIRVALEANRLGGSNCNAYFDDLTLRVADSGA